MTEPKPAESASPTVETLRKHGAVVVAGPSGVGKGTLLKMLHAEFGDIFANAVSHTTRKPREGEVDGTHYHFVTREKFEDGIKEGLFIEYAEVHGQLYGKSYAAVDAVAKTGKICVMELDIKGVQTVSQSTALAPPPFFMWVAPPSFEDLQSRLQGRGTETTETLQRRLATAEKELSAQSTSDLFHWTLVNKDLNEAYGQLTEKLAGLYPHVQQHLQKGKKTHKHEGKGTAHTHRPVVIAGPSGVGKGTLLKMLHAELGDHFAAAISHTTRKPREGEKDGVHYHFVAREKFEAMIKDGQFIEYAEVHGNLYGKSFDSVAKVCADGRICVMELDIKGVQTVSESSALSPSPFFMWVAPPSFEDLQSRLQGRGSETDETLQRRLATARKELKFAEDSDVFHWTLVNQDLQESYATLKAKLTELFPHIAEGTKATASSSTSTPEPAAAAVTSG